MSNKAMEPRGRHKLAPITAGKSSTLSRATRVLAVSTSFCAFMGNDYFAYETLLRGAYFPMAPEKGCCGWL
jgi:hypothetical protein